MLFLCFKNCFNPIFITNFASFFIKGSIFLLKKTILFKYKILKKNAFDYFIKIRNFENEEIKFLYPNTKF